MSAVWQEKLESFIPAWVYREGVRSKAVIAGIAAAFGAIEQDIDDIVGQAYIDRSIGQYLVLHGQDRGKVRQPGESVEAFRQRIKSLHGKSGCPELALFINSSLENGEAILTEQDSLRTFLNGTGFVGDNMFLSGESYNNHFIVIAPRNNSEQVLNSIITTVNQDRAFGTAWTLVRRL